MANAVALGDQLRRKEAMEALVTEISRCEEDTLAPSIRSSLERGWGFNFVEVLAEARKRREYEIDKICSRHYSEFLLSVQELLQMRGSASNISSLIIEIHQFFKSAFEELSSIVNTLEILQKERSNILTMLTNINRYRELAELLVHAKEFIKAENHYRALAIIESLQRELNGVNVTPFMNLLLKSLPHLVDELLNTSKTGLFDWLSSMQRQYEAVGVTLMRQAAEINLKLSDDKSTSMSLQLLTHIAPIYEWNKLHYDFKDIIPEDFTASASQEHINLISDISDHMEPLHKASYIYGRLNRQTELQTIYYEHRLSVIQSVISSDITAQIAALGLEVVIPRILHQICGFFVIENIYSYNSNYILSKQHINDLYKIICKDVHALISQYSYSFNNTSQILLTKENLLLFHDTLTDDAFAVSSYNILSITNILWEPFLALIASEFQIECTRILASTTYQPVEISTEEYYQRFIVALGLHHVNLDSTDSSKHILDHLEDEYRSSYVDVADKNEFMPHTLPFSEFVPLVMREVHFSLIKFVLFTAHNDALATQPAQLCQCIEKCLAIAHDSLVDELQRDGTETSLSKAAQISLDSSALSQAMSSLHTVISSILIQAHWIDSTLSVNTYIESIRNKLDQLTIKAQDLIFELLSSKVMDLLSSLIFIDWTPQKYPSGPHEIIEQVVEYLKVTFMWLTHLPRNTREAVHFAVCSKINQGLLDFLYTKVNKVNMLSLLNLELDIRHLDMFADNSGVTQLRHCFNEIRELVKALLHPDLPQFGDTAVALRQNLFPSLDPQKLATVVEKVFVYLLTL